MLDTQATASAVTTVNRHLQDALLIGKALTGHEGCSTLGLAGHQNPWTITAVSTRFGHEKLLSHFILKMSSES